MLVSFLTRKNAVWNCVEQSVALSGAGPAHLQYSLHVDRRILAQFGGQSAQYAAQCQSLSVVQLHVSSHSVRRLVRLVVRFVHRVAATARAHLVFVRTAVRSNAQSARPGTTRYTLSRLPTNPTRSLISQSHLIRTDSHLNHPAHTLGLRWGVWRALCGTFVAALIYISFVNVTLDLYRKRLHLHSSSDQSFVTSQPQLTYVSQHATP